MAQTTEEAAGAAVARLAVERLRALIRVSTVSRTSPAMADEHEFSRFRALLAQLYPLTHSRLELEMVAGGTLLFRWPGQGTGAPNVLMAHYDVVPADEPGWTYGAFGAELTPSNGFGAAEQSTTRARSP
jgi:carboxypeptidase PM20D1